MRIVPLPDGVTKDGAIRVDKLLAKVGLAESVSDAVRKIKAGAVEINGEKVEDLAVRPPLSSSSKSAKTGGESHPEVEQSCGLLQLFGPERLNPGQGTQTSSPHPGLFSGELTTEKQLSGRLLLFRHFVRVDRIDRLTRSAHCKKVGPSTSIVCSNPSAQWTSTREPM